LVVVDLPEKEIPVYLLQAVALAVVTWKVRLLCLLRRRTQWWWVLAGLESQRHMV